MTPKKSFNTAVVSSIKAVALLIDVQSFEGMSREDAIAYKNALGEKLTKFREEGTPVIWVAIAPGGSKLLLPTAQHDSDKHIRRSAELLEMGFTGHLDGVANNDIYADFIREFGPRENEIVYRKPTMSALATANDFRDKDRLLEEGGIKVTSTSHPYDDKDTKYIMPDGYIRPDDPDAELASLFGGNSTLSGYLDHQEIEEMYLMGAVSKYCVTETAISSAIKGFNTNILSNLVLSWKYPVDAETRVHGQLVWANFDHEALIKEAISKATVEREYTPKEIRAINFIRFSQENQSHQATIDSINRKRDFE